MTRLPLPDVVPASVGIVLRCRIESRTLCHRPGRLQTPAGSDAGRFVLLPSCASPKSASCKSADWSQWWCAACLDEGTDTGVGNFRPKGSTENGWAWFPGTTRGITSCRDGVAPARMVRNFQRLRAFFWARCNIVRNLGVSPCGTTCATRTQRWFRSSVRSRNRETGLARSHTRSNIGLGCGPYGPGSQTFSCSRRSGWPTSSGRLRLWLSGSKRERTTGSSLCGLAQARELQVLGRSYSSTPLWILATAHRRHVQDLFAPAKIYLLARGVLRQRARWALWDSSVHRKRAMSKKDASCDHSARSYKDRRTSLCGSAKSQCLTESLADVDR